MSTTKQYELSVQCQEKAQEVTTEMVDKNTKTYIDFLSWRLFFYISWLQRCKVKINIVFAKSLFPCWLIY